MKQTQIEILRDELKDYLSELDSLSRSLPSLVSSMQGTAILIESMVSSCKRSLEILSDAYQGAK